MKAFAKDKNILCLIYDLMNVTRKSTKYLSALYRYSSDRYTTREEFLYYKFVFQAHNDLLLRIIHECHDALNGGYRGREKAYLTVSLGFYWPIQYPFVRN